MMKFKDYYNFKLFNQFCDFLNEDDRYICEIFNTKLNIKEVSNPILDFETEFIIDDNTYRFMSKKLDNNVWSIGFLKNYDLDFKRLNSKRYVGDVFTGVFESLKMLLYKERDIKKIIFKTNTDNKHLIKFYTSNIFKKYLTSHFKFELEYEGNAEWCYKKI